MNEIARDNFEKFYILQHINSRLFWVFFFFKSITEEPIFWRYGDEITAVVIFCCSLSSPYILSYQKSGKKIFPVVKIFLYQIWSNRSTRLWNTAQPTDGSKTTCFGIREPQNWFIRTNLTSLDFKLRQRTK